MSRRRCAADNSVVDARGAFVDRSEQISSTRQVLHRQLKKQCFAGKAGTDELANFGIVRFAVSDGVIEDCRIGGQTSDREILDVALESAAIEQLARDVIEPDALSQIVEL